MLETLNRLLNDGIDAAVISLLVMVGATAAIPEWRSNRGYMLAGWVVGVIVGLAAVRMNVPEGFAILLTAIGVVTGPITLAKMHGRTMGDVLDEVTRRRANGGADPEAQNKPRPKPGQDV